MTKPSIYLVGSLRNPKVVEVTTKLEAGGISVFSDWFAAGPLADDAWQEYEKARGRTYREALASPAAQNVFRFDVRNILKSDFVALVAPAGKSGHLELGFAAGCGKPTFILMDEPGTTDRWDVMTLFAGDPLTSHSLHVFREPGVVYTVDELVERIEVFRARKLLDTIPDNPRLRN